MRNGDMSRYQYSDPSSYLSVTGSFPLGGLITDIVETPRGVYAFWQATTLSTGTTCKIFYIAKTVVSSAETLAPGLSLVSIASLSKKYPSAIASRVSDSHLEKSFQSILGEVSEIRKL